MQLTPAKFEDILGKFSTLSIAVVGDLFLDRYLDLDAGLTEKSVETGLDAYQVVGDRCYPGAAGTVLNNLAALGVGTLKAISVVGCDGGAYELLRGLERINVDSTHVVQCADRMTPTYTKPMLSQSEGPAVELNRIDIKNRVPQGSEIDQQVIAHIDAVFGEVDALVVMDQVDERNNGVVTDAVREHISRLGSEHPGKLIFADSRSQIRMYRHVTTKPNNAELLKSIGVSSSRAEDRDAIAAAGKKLSQTTGRPVYTTLGEAGILYCDADTTTHIPTVPVTGEIDIVGAGDSTTAGIVSSLGAGATAVEAAEIGCLVASITVQQIGVTGTASPEALRKRFQERA
ncbi:Bifunctional protein HldE [Symmachiella dynata]|uniref:Bifunctional protein HldE n=1 Tax=Symmachiella dynata TaxID=2527995 RepID=A0A517ZSK5_9PLAN|nr:PfkB family carbohydrate kinase [Symmachiella dynata]QDU45433.1 Bifunctional protein HldE [Symmachiella dynata]